MKKLDRRIVRTRLALCNALASLSLEKSYDDITIRELTQRAMIGYATFYRHYKSKDEVLLHVVKQEMCGLKAAMLHAKSPFDESVIMYRRIRSGNCIYRLFASLPLQSSTSQLIQNELKLLAFERYQERESATVTLDVAMNHLVRSGHFLLRWYLDNLDQCSAEKMAEMYIGLIVRPVAHMAFVPRDEWLQRFSAD